MYQSNSYRYYDKVEFKKALRIFFTLNVHLRNLPLEGTQLGIEHSGYNCRVRPQVIRQRYAYCVNIIQQNKKDLIFHKLLNISPTVEYHNKNKSVLTIIRKLPSLR